VEATSLIAAEATSLFSVAKAATKTIVLIIGAIVPLDVLRVLWLLVLKEVGDFLLGLKQDLDEILADIFIAVVVEGSGLTLIADTSSTANAMDVLSDALVLGRWEVIVDDVLHIGNIQAASGNAGSNKDRTPSCTEGTSNTVSDITVMD
jgi:hypothetical protein